MSSKHKMTIQEVADEAQVSKTTVSFFLNGKREKMSASTWNRIAAVVEKYDYRPSTTARLMTAKHSCLLGVLVGDITHHFPIVWSRASPRSAAPAATKSSLARATMTRTPNACTSTA